MVTSSITGRSWRSHNITASIRGPAGRTAPRPRARSSVANVITVSFTCMVALVTQLWGWRERTSCKSEYGRMPPALGINREFAARYIGVGPTLFDEMVTDG